MLKKYSVLRGFVILCVGLFVFCLPPLQAQDSDFVTWNKMKARPFPPAPSVSINTG